MLATKLGRYKMIFKKILMIVMGTAIAFSVAATPVQSPLFTGELYKNAIWPSADLSNTTLQKQHLSLLKDCSDQTTEGAGSQNRFDTCVTNELQNNKGAIFFWEKFNGFINSYKEFGPVTFLRATVFAADHSIMFVLLNKQGLLIDSGDYELLNGPSIIQSPEYLKAIQKYPNDFLNTLPQDIPVVVKTKDGGQNFIFPYTVVKCMACAIDATFKIAFKFDSQGNFKGVQIVD